VPYRITERQSNDVEHSPIPRRSAIPSPNTWVFHTKYPDQLIWYRYPETGARVNSDGDYALNTVGDRTHPPYEERCDTAILERCWPRDVPKWKATPWLTLTIGSTVVLSLTDQPSDVDGLNRWWDIVSEVLSRSASDGSLGTVPADLDDTYLCTARSRRSHSRPL